MKWVIAYLAVGVLVAAIKWRKVVTSIDRNPQFVAFKKENPARWNAVRKITIAIGVVVNILLWPVIVVGDIIRRDHNE